MLAVALWAALVPAAASDSTTPPGPLRSDTGTGMLDAQDLRDLIDRAATRVPPARADRPRLPPIVDDPALREAALNLWLDQLAARPMLNDAERDALQALPEQLPVVWIAHHEAGGRAMPAFAVSVRARSLLDFDRRWRKAAVLAERADLLLAALVDAADSETLVTLELAVEQLAPEQQRVLALRLPNQPASQARDRTALKLARRSAEHESLLPWLVARAGLAEARQALQFAIEMSSPELPEVAARAIARPELGGLVVEAQLLSGGSIERLWSWLDEPQLGADAARVLAERLPGLAAEVRARINAAPIQARLRMLLALKLSGDAEARALLALLAESEWLQPSQREVLRRWK